MGNNAFYTSNLAATGTVCRIRNSESMSIKTYTKEECLLEEKNAKTLKALKSLIRRYTDVERNPPEIIDVYLRAPILRVILQSIKQFISVKEGRKILCKLLKNYYIEISYCLF